MNDDKVIRTIRLAHWEQAKGHLRAILQTYWNPENEENYRNAKEAFEALVEQVEAEGIVE